MSRNKQYLGLWIAALLLMFSCKDAVLYGPDPYAGGKEGPVIRFADELPYPSQGRSGALITFKVHGAAAYKDKLQFLINGLEAEIREVTDSTLTAVLPDNVSTGGSSLVVDGQIYAGPICRITGKLGIDQSFNAGVGANGTVNFIKQIANGHIFIGGSFTDYNGFAASTRINGIARISANGSFVRGMSFGHAVLGGSALHMHELADGNLLLSGNILNYDSVSLVSNIVKINRSGALVRQAVNILNITDDPSKSTLRVPVFNGGTNATVVKSFVHNNTVTAIGGFNAYVDRFYQRSTYDNILTGYFLVGGVVRMHMNGGLDEAFNINKDVIPFEAKKGFSGFLFDGAMQSDGKLIVVGKFNRYNDGSVQGNILRLHRDGTIDNSFQVGAGGNEYISSVTPSRDKDKYYLTGSFTSFNGHSFSGLLRINQDGSIDQSFVNLGFTGGNPNFVRELSNGLLLVTGSFSKYNGVIREGLCVLNSDGSLAEDYNNTGKLDGLVYDALEGRNSLGQASITLVGLITRFDGKSNIGNIMRLTILD